MDKFKTFYNEKNGKMILFFGFYLIFFIFLGFYLRDIKANKPKEEKKEETVIEEKITSYDLSKLITNDYKYIISVFDNDETITFNGSKSNIDYANYPNRYFFDIYSINQLLKKSKFIDSNNYVLSYELNNSELNEILLTDKGDGVNKIDVYVNEKKEVNKIVLNLREYMEKDKYEIIITYLVGEENENSPS